MIRMEKGLSDCINCEGEKCADCQWTGFVYTNDQPTVEKIKAPIVRMKKIAASQTAEQQRLRRLSGFELRQMGLELCITCDLVHKIDSFKTRFVSGKYCVNTVTVGE